MRHVVTFLILVSAVLVPWSSLAPASLHDTPGSGISHGAGKSKPMAARLSPALGILPIIGSDDGPPSFDAMPRTALKAVTDSSQPRMVCENGVCRLVTDSDSIAPGSWPQGTACASNRAKLEEIGATQVRVEYDAAGTWRCCCSVPVSSGSKVMRRFETTGETEEQAVQQAQQAVEAWLRNHR